MKGFTPFQKLARLSRECMITEKLDGTNAQIKIVDLVTSNEEIEIDQSQIIATRDKLIMLAGSRSRFLGTVGKDDNFGFAKWAQENSAELFKLGPGTHFGEWWGSGIQRGYGLSEKRFSLFAAHRWQQVNAAQRAGHAVATPFPTCCDVVPVLAVGTFTTELVEAVCERLRVFGSEAAPGFMQPEGVVVFHTAAGVAFKKALDNDGKPKGAQHWITSRASFSPTPLRATAKRSSPSAASTMPRSPS